MTLPATAAKSNTRAEIRRVAVILNPASGRGQGARRRAELERLLQAESRPTGPSRPTGQTWRILETTAPGGGVEAARRAVEEGADVVAAAGGDGTYGEVA